MPLITLQYRAPVGQVTAEFLADRLPAIVAKALTCDNPDGSLEADEIEIDVEPMPSGMRTQFDLHIVVDANEYPERLVNLAERQAMITRAVRAFFLGNPQEDFIGIPKGFVWVRLSHASFWEI